MKTKIVFCKQSNRKGVNYSINSFKFVRVQFRPVKRKARNGKAFQGFSTTVPLSSTVKIGLFIRGLELHRKSKTDIYKIAELINNRIQSWINYFKNWDIHSNCGYFFYRLNTILLKWAKKRYKRLKSKKRTIGLMKQIQRQQPNLFAHWKYGFTF